MASSTSLPQIYIGGDASTRPPDRGLSGVKKKAEPQPGYKAMSPAKSKNMLNKARQAGGDATKQALPRVQGII